MEKQLLLNLLKQENLIVLVGEEFIVDFLGEGHTADNVVVWFPKYKILDGGCLVKSKAAVDLGYGRSQCCPMASNHDKTEKTNITGNFDYPRHDEWKGGGHVEHTLDLLNKIITRRMVALRFLNHHINDYYFLKVVILFQFLPWY